MLPFILILLIGIEDDPFKEKKNGARLGIPPFDAEVESGNGEAIRMIADIKKGQSRA